MWTFGIRCINFYGYDFVNMLVFNVMTACLCDALKALYEQSLHIKSAIPHPLIMGVIRGIS